MRVGRLVEQWCGAFMASILVLACFLGCTNVHVSCLREMVLFSLITTSSWAHIAMLGDFYGYFSFTNEVEAVPERWPTTLEKSSTRVSVQALKI